MCKAKNVLFRSSGETNLIQARNGEATLEQLLNFVVNIVACCVHCHYLRLEHYKGARHNTCVMLVLSIYQLSLNGHRPWPRSPVVRNGCS